MIEAGPKDDMRFIPTPVGNGGGISNPVAVVAVHPHACGERVLATVVWLRVGGSSPRLWGTGF